MSDDEFNQIIMPAPMIPPELLALGNAPPDRIGDRGVQCAVGKGGQFRRDPRERKGTGQIANAQRHRQRQLFAAQGGAHLVAA